ncbi:MAG: hypothetical protein RJQ01_05775 [Microcella sp.]|uniref:hypothetical protein n=1 Tax=Microcella sp. TaxID=1913979 RepID=UPI0033153C1D
MTPQDDLAARLAEEAERSAPRSALDVDAIVRRSRARRRPALIGTGVVATVLIVGIGGLSVGALGSLVPNDLTAADTASTAEEAAVEQGGSPEMDGGEAADGGSALAPDWLQNRCGSAPVTPADVPDAGLLLEIDFPARATTADDRVEGTVRVTNTSGERVSGRVSSSPAITLASGGLTVWHTSGVAEQGERTIALDPGESREFAAVLRPLLCTIDDEVRASEGFDAGLAPLPPGEYAVSAVLDIVVDDAPQVRTPLVSAPEPLVLEPPEG